MSETALAMVPTAPVIEPDNFTVIAREPAEMQRSQNALVEWAKQKLAAEKAALVECKEQFDIAVKNKWRATAWKSQMRRAAREVVYYEKILAALEAGYYIVPPFPAQVFAVRTNQWSPDRKSSTWYGSNFEQGGRALAIGQGRYVQAVPDIWKNSEVVKNQTTGKEETVTTYWAHNFRELIDFPFKFAKPAVLNATARAMAMNLFDKLAVVPAYRAADPIVVGQIVNPNNRYKTPITFLIAWWLDTRTL